MGEIEVVGGFVMVEDENRGGIEAVFYGGIFEEFTEENRGGGVNDNISVGFIVEFVRDARPVGKIMEIFRDVNGAKKGDFEGIFG